MLCADKNDTVVKFSLPQDNTHILTSKYELYLPSEDKLVEEVKKLLDEANVGDVE